MIAEGLVAHLLSTLPYSISFVQEDDAEIIAELKHGSQHLYREAESLVLDDAFQVVPHLERKFFNLWSNIMIDSHIRILLFLSQSVKDRNVGLKKGNSEVLEQLHFFLTAAYVVACLSVL